MISYFLKAKHWQIFLLTFGIPALIQMAFIAVLLTHIIYRSPDIVMLFSIFYLLIFVQFIFGGIFLIWLWSIAVGLQKFIPVNMRFKTKLFQKCFIVLLLYLIFFMFFSLRSVLFDWNLSNAIVVIIPFHLLIMFGFLYILYFAAKTFKTAELQREVNFSEFSRELFMICLYPVGIWIIQPKINQILGKVETENE